jgi:hypothetical protein
MDEARRFLRYVTPGLVFMTEVLVVLWVIAPDWTCDIMDGFKKDVGAGLAIVTLFASGGIGFIFSSIHHYIHWRCESCVIDHRGLLVSLRSHGILCLVDRDSGDALPESETPDRFQAWAILTALWHERLADGSGKIKSADPRVTSLSDLAHSAGSARVAAGSAWIISLFVLGHCCSYSTEIYAVARFVVGNALAVLLLWLHHKGYERIGEAMCRVVEQVLCDALSEETARNRGTIQTHVTLG